MSTREESANVMSLLLGSIASILSDRGRNRHHEYHAGLCDRTDQRNRIRIAVGAKSRDILLQFLIESLILSLAGGILGIGIGMIGTIILSSLLSGRSSSRRLQFSLHFLFSGSVGYSSDSILREKPHFSIPSMRSAMNNFSQAAEVHACVP